MRLLSSTSILLPRTTCCIISQPVSSHGKALGAYKGKALGVHGAGLDEEFVPPAVERVETLGVVDIVDENAAVGTTVESHTKRLEALLSCGVPELCGYQYRASGLSREPPTCIVTRRSSTRTSFVKKSAPMVAL